MKKTAWMLLFCLLCALLCGALAEENTKVKHYLLLGEDGYAEELVDDARTDTIVLVSLDQQYNRVIMTSILRDSRITNPRGNSTKANLLFKGYGFDGVISCFERELGIEIEGAVLVNFEHVKPIIDALGGVDLVIDENEYVAIKKILLGKDPNMPKGPGLVHMTGRIALAYMRDRSSGSGDFSRTQRQRKVVSQLFEKCRDMSLSQLVDIFNAVSSGMRMSMNTLGILSAMQQGYSLIENGAEFVEFRIPRRGTYSYGSLAEGSSTLEVRWSQNREAFHKLLNNEE